MARINDPSELAVTVAKAPSAEERQQAMAALTPVVVRLAEEVGRQFDPRVTHDLVGEAPGLLWEKLTRPGASTYDPRGGRFEDWCRAVLRNWTLDRLRRAAADPLRAAPGGLLDEQAEDPSAAREADAQEAAALVERDLAQVRRLLDEVRGAGWSARGVDFYAVFLFYLRWALATRLSHTWVEEGAGLPPGEMAGLVARCLPWRDGERRLRFRPGAPTLAELWAAVAGALDSPPYRLPVADLCAALSRLWPGRVVTMDAWYQWVKRARDFARAQVDPALWERLFSPWLPAPRVRGGPGP
jgi:DNA-directed RNA polymerase specialized sigma24 family protein